VFGPCPETGDEEQLASAGKPVHVKLIALVKLLEAMIPTLVLPDCPGVVMVTLLGPETATNPG
jgi:hypothetical protein